MSKQLASFSTNPYSPPSVKHHGLGHLPPTGAQTSLYLWFDLLLGWLFFFSSSQPNTPNGRRGRGSRSREVGTDGVERGPYG